MPDQDFVATYGPLAQDIAQQTGLDPSVVLGVIDTETGSGRHVAGNNIFGVSPGGRVAGYPDVSAAGQAFVDLINSRYRGVASLPPDQQPAGLVRGGYNRANPNYAASVLSNATAARSMLTPQPAAATYDFGSTQSPPATPNYNNPPPPAQPGQSEKDRALQSLDQAATTGTQTSQPGQSEKDKALAALPPPPPATEKEKPSTTAAAEPQPPVVEPEYSSAAVIPQSVTDAIGRVASAGAQGWEGGPSLPRVPTNLVMSPIYNPLIAGAEAVLSGGNALLRGAQQTAVEATPNIRLPSLPPGVTIPLGGNRQLSGELTPGPLGREIAAMPEAFPLGGRELGTNALAGPRPPGEAAPPPPPQYVQERFGEPPPGRLAQITGAIERADQQPPRAPPAERPVEPPRTVEQYVDDYMAGRGRDSPDHLQFAANNGPAIEAEFQRRAAARGEPAPTAAGAQATPPEDIPDAEAIGRKPSPDRVRNIEYAANRSAEDRAGPQMTDETAYVPDIPGRVLASRQFTTENSINHKFAYNDGSHPEYKASVDKGNKERNEGMVEMLRNDAGDANSLDQSQTYRKEASPDKMGVFTDEKPVDVSDIAGDIRKDLAGAGGKRGAVQTALNGLLERLYVGNDVKGGTLETSPSMIYGARQHITDMLAKGPMTEEGAAARTAKSYLTKYLDKFDAKIAEGAPKYSDYMREWADRSQRINQQEFLQPYMRQGGPVINRDGYLQLNGLNKMLGDITAGLKADKPNKAWSLTDEQIQNIINARNELAADRLNERLGEVRGSPTYQLQSVRAAKQRSVMGEVARATGRMGTTLIGSHLAHADPMVSNALMWAAHVGGPAIRQARVERAISKAEAADAAMRARLLDRTHNPLSEY